MQNDAKMHHKSARNDNEKTQIPMSQWSKTHAVDRAAKLHENAFIFVVPVLRCSKNEFSNHPKSSRIYPKCPPRGGPIRSVYKKKKHVDFLRSEHPSYEILRCGYLGGGDAGLAPGHQQGRLRPDARHAARAGGGPTARAEYRTQ